MKSHVLTRMNVAPAHQVDVGRIEELSMNRNLRFRDLVPHKHKIDATKGNPPPFLEMDIEAQLAANSAKNLSLKFARPPIWSLMIPVALELQPNGNTLDRISRSPAEIDSGCRKWDASRRSNSRCKQFIEMDFGHDPIKPALGSKSPGDAIE